MGGKKRKLQQHAANRAAGRPRKTQQYKPDVLVNKKPGAVGASVVRRPAKVAKTGGKKNTQPQKAEKPTIPFESHDRILLIGEGDLSFATSIIEHHGCVNVTATVLEKDEEELLEKYPHAKRNIAIVRGEPYDDSEEVKQVEDGSEEDEWKGIDDGDDNDDEPEKDEEEAAHDEEKDQEDVAEQSTSNEPNESDGDDDDDYDEDNPRPKRLPRNNKLIFNIDVTKLPPSLTRIRHNTIIFNFPHVGGKSTDINRQVRHNQSLLVAFFQRALPGLAPRGSIVVTLFEGEPYTLWNIRDLARHAGLAVERSFRFQAAAYPGYHHARTLGVVRNKKGEEGGGWKGEERSARSFVFRRKGDVEETGRKRKKGNDSSDDED